MSGETGHEKAIEALEIAQALELLAYHNAGYLSQEMINNGRRSREIQQLHYAALIGLNAVNVPARFAVPNHAQRVALRATMPNATMPAAMPNTTRIAPEQQTSDGARAVMESVNRMNKESK